MTICASFQPATRRQGNPPLCACGHGPSRHAPVCRVCPEVCCFEGCGQPAVAKLGRAVYFPMCAEHAAQVTA